MREMKDSGVRWIGEIPTQWTIQRAKNSFAQKSERGNSESLVLLSPTQNYGVIPQELYEQLSGLRAVKLSTETELSSLKTVHKGAYVISLRSFQGGFEYSEYEGVVSPAYQVFYPLVPVSDHYYRYLFKSQAFIDKMNSFTLSLRDGKNIAFSDFARTYIPVPPLSEQHSIAEFLSNRCSQVNTLIANVQAQIEKMKAYKQSVITEVVTKGLDPTVPMKDSDFDWIGRIPAHWEKLRVKYIGDTQNGISKGGEYFGSGYPFVSYGDVYKNMELPHSVVGLVESTDAERQNYSVKKGDIFFTRTSETIEEVGFSSVCTKTIEEATFAGFLIRLRPYNDVVTTQYAKYYFRGDHIRRYLVKEMHLVTRASLGQGLLKAMTVLIPPHKEQLAIAEYLDSKCSQIDHLIALKQSKIEKLEQYKKSLIYEYVTGKKEVS